jgi:Rhodopirellula transposase DDE domain
MELTDELKTVYIKTAQKLKGSERRMFMAQIVKTLGKGGQRRAERELGWHRNLVRKGTRELESGIPYEDNFSARGRKRAEEHLPHLLEDIKAIADAQSQTDPTFQTTRVYTRISAAEIRRQLIGQKGYSDEELPSEETIRVKMNDLGYCLRSVQKSRPKKDSAD